MSYMEPIDTEIVQAVVDDLRDNNGHTLADMLCSYYGLPGAVPTGEFYKAYRAARWVIEGWRIEKSKLDRDLERRMEQTYVS